jgi:hypothetical protein
MIDSGSRRIPEVIPFNLLSKGYYPVFGAEPKFILTYEP